MFKRNSELDFLTSVLSYKVTVINTHGFGIRTDGEVKLEFQKYTHMYIVN